MTCMTTADPATGLERLNALITPNLWKQVDGTNRAAVVGWGTMLNVAHLVRGIRTLHAAGQCHAALPLLRSVMEYALGTIWLVDAGEDAVDVLNRRLQGSHGKLLADLGDTDLDADFPAEAVQAFRDILAALLPPHPDERLSAFRHLLNAYGFEKMIPVYNVISGITHLSLEGAQAFFEDRDGAIHLSQQPRKGESAPCEVICLGMQFDTMLAYNELLTPRPWTADLAAIAKDHELPCPAMSSIVTSRRRCPAGRCPLRRYRAPRRPGGRPAPARLALRGWCRPGTGRGRAPAVRHLCLRPRPASA